MKHLENVTKQEYSYYSTTSYDRYDELGYLDDMLDEIERYDGNTYICDVISQVADNYVSIYNGEIWKEAAIISEYIEEAINEQGGLIDDDLIRTFQYGIFRYNELGLYGNIDEIIYNVAINILDKLFEESNLEIKVRLLEVDEDRVMDYIDGMGTDNRFQDIEDAMEKLIEDLSEEEEEE